MAISPYNLLSNRPPAFVGVLSFLANSSKVKPRKGPLPRTKIIKLVSGPVRNEQRRITENHLGVYFQFLTLEGVVIASGSHDQFFVDIERCQTMFQCLKSGSIIPPKQDEQICRQVIEGAWKAVRQCSVQSNKPVEGEEMLNEKGSATTEKTSFTHTAFFSPIEQHLHTALGVEARVVTVSGRLRVIVCDEKCEPIPTGAINLSQIAKEFDCPPTLVGQALDRFERNLHIRQINEGGTVVDGRIFELLYNPFLVDERLLHDNRPVTLSVLKGFECGHKEIEPVQKQKDPETSPVKLPAVTRSLSVPTSRRVFLTPEEAQTLLTCVKTKVFVDSVEGREVASLLENKPLIGAMCYHSQRFLVVTPHEENGRRFYEIKPDVAARCVFLLQNGRGTSRSVTKANHTRQPIDRWLKGLEELAVKAEKPVPDLSVVVESKPHKEEKTESRQIAEVEVRQSEVPIYVVEILSDEATRILQYVNGNFKCSTRDLLPNRLVKALRGHGFFMVTKIGRRVRVLVDREKIAFFRFVERDLQRIHNKSRLTETSGQPDAEQCLRDLEMIAAKNVQQPLETVEPVQEIQLPPELEEDEESEESEDEDVEEVEEETESDIQNLDDSGLEALVERFDLAIRDSQSTIKILQQEEAGLVVKLQAMQAEQNRRRELKRQKLIEQKAKQDSAAEKLRRQLAEAEAEAVRLETELNGLS